MGCLFMEGEIGFCCLMTAVAYVSVLVPVRRQTRISSNFINRGLISDLTFFFLPERLEPGSAKPMAKPVEATI